MIVFSRDALWVERLRRLAARGGWPFARFEDAPRATSGAASRGGLVVVDRELAARSPAGAVKKLRALHPRAAIVLACAESELGSAAVAAALSSGADDAVVKAWDDERLRARLAEARDRAIAADERHVPDGSLRAERRSRRVYARRGGRWSPVELPAAEFTLLWTLLSAGGEAVSRGRLLDELRADAGVEVEAATVARRMLALRRALAPRGVAVVSVRGGCYRLAPASPSRRRSTT